MPRYINETPTVTPITAVETAVPVFIGYTEKTRSNAGSLQYKPARIASFSDYTATFGVPCSVSVQLELTANNTLKNAITVIPPPFLLAYAVQLYFANGGGHCFVISAGTYKRAGAQSALRLRQLQQALAAAEAEKNITLLCLPDAALLAEQDYYTFLNDALQQCGRCRNRFAILDVPQPPRSSAADALTRVEAFRNGIGTEHLSFGAAYYPWLRTDIPLQVSERGPGVLQISGGAGLPTSLVLRKADRTNVRSSLYHLNRSLYDAVIAAVKTQTAVLPPCGAVAGIYSRTDRERGVWKAPANTVLASVLAPQVQLSERDATVLNVDDREGKSINTIRSFAGRGVVLWGARTLAGNNNDWRYVSVRRFFLMVEGSVQKGTAWAIFEPNALQTWAKIKAVTESFLLQLWRQGALQGAKSEHAFYVAVGTGSTMTEQDIREGRLVLEIGMAAVRPAEFIILRISYKMVPA